MNGQVNHGLSGVQEERWMNRGIHQEGEEGLCRGECQVVVERARINLVYGRDEIVQL